MAVPPIGLNAFNIPEKSISREKKNLLLRNLKIGLTFAFLPNQTFLGFRKHPKHPHPESSLLPVNGKDWVALQLQNKIKSKSSN